MMMSGHALLPAKSVQESSSFHGHFLHNIFSIPKRVGHYFTRPSQNMKTSHRRRLSFSSSSTITTVTYTLRNDQPAPPTSTQIPIQSSETPIPITVHVPQSAAAAVKIQSAYRSHLIRNLYKTIAAVHSEADEFQRLIQRQETVDSVRSSEREKLRMNEAIMKLLLKLDSVPGVDPAVRDARRKVSRRIVGLQEILDAIVQVDVDGFWGCGGGFGRDYWNDVVAEMEEGVCRERGGEEMERFCAEHLGFRCLQRFLSQP